MSILNKNTAKYLKLFPILFILNFVWESLHAALYMEYSPLILSFPKILLASIADGLWLILLIIIIDKYWSNNDTLKLKFLYVLLLSILTAIIVEFVAMYYGLWHYTDTMPTIFSLGISPILQLPTTLALFKFYHVRIRKFVV